MEQCVIYRTDIDMYCRWDENVIIFDNVDQANDFIEEFSFFFNDVEYPEVIHIIPVPLEFEEAYVIKCEDITEDSKNETRQYYKQNIEMKGMLKDE